MPLLDEAKGRNSLRTMALWILRQLGRLSVLLLLTGLWAWTTGAFWFAEFSFPPARMFIATIYALAVPATLFFSRSRLKTVLVLLLGFVASVGWHITIRPSNHRPWEANLAVLPWARVTNDRVVLHNIRNTRYRSEEDYDVQHYDRTYKLDKLVQTWFVVVPFGEEALTAHTFVSFEFEGDEFLSVSIEVRREKDEVFGLIPGLFKRFEIIYVAADERDVIGVRAAHRKNIIYLYPLQADDPANRRRFFLGLIGEMNKLRDRPAFYHSVTRNCTTALVRHANDIVPDQVPLGIEILLPGLMDQLLYRIGAIDTKLPLEQAREKARIEKLAVRYIDDPEFSKKIRGR